MKPLLRFSMCAALMGASLFVPASSRALSCADPNQATLALVSVEEDDVALDPESWPAFAFSLGYTRESLSVFYQLRRTDRGGVHTIWIEELVR